MWLGLALGAGVAACSVDPLVPIATDGGAAGKGGSAGTTGIAGTTGAGGSGSVDGGACSGLPIPAIACAVGRTYPECSIGPNGQLSWKITCPDDPTGAGGGGGADAGTCGGLPISSTACAVGRTFHECVIGADGRPRWMTVCPDDPTGAGGGGGAAGSSGAAGTRGTAGANGGAAGLAGRGGAGGAGGAPCTSTSSCAKGEVCTVSDGVCNAPPGCGAGAICPAVCYGNCRPADGVACGSTRCAAGMVCCNESCGTCTEPNGGCTKQICAAAICLSDADCRVEADYCTGCDCRVLARIQSVPPCPGPGVRCLVDPCMGKKALCVNGQCVTQ